MLSDKALREIAGIIGESGTCERLQVGAVLTINRRIISTGYNGAASGVTHCYHKDGDTRFCEVAVHAEANAIAFAARHGVETDGSVLYVTHSPCVTCARLLINAGVVEVIYEHEYRDARGIGELAQAGVQVKGPYGSGVRAMPAEPVHRESLYPGQSPDPRVEGLWDTDSQFDSR